MSTEEDIHTQLSRQFLDGESMGDDLLETTQTIRFPFADVHSQEWYVDGMRIGYSDWKAKQPINLDWKMDLPTDVITLYFNLKGKTTTEQAQQGKPIELSSYQHNLFYAPESKGNLKSKNEQLSTFMVQFPLNTFLRISDETNDGLKRFADQVVRKRPVALSAKNLYLTGDMQQAISVIINCPYKGGLKKMFLRAKTLELLVMQAEASSQSQTATTRYLKTASDKERIWFVRDCLTQHLDSPPSLTQLAREAGINEYKLKRGFKEMFGTTVFGYLSDRRLELAKADLLENKLSAGEIAFNLGYSSLQHFSTAFKKKYQIAPSQLRA